MKYGVFISYTSGDRPWAQKLADELKGENVFFDRERLDVGKNWPTQLLQDLQESQHLVVLWSSKANASSWVQKELAHFDNLAAADNQRRLICVNLEGDNPAYSLYQAVELLKEEKVYPGDPQKVESKHWSAVVNQIKKSLSSDGATRIAVAALTLKEDEVNKKAGQVGLSEAEFTEIHNNFGLSRDEVCARYGSRRWDWKPYGGVKPLDTMLDELIAGLNTAVAGLVRVGSMRFGWEPVSEDFWQPTGNRAREVAVDMRSAKLSLVVIDTLALVWRPVLQRAMMLKQYLNHGTSAWLVVPPRASKLDFRTALRGWSDPLLDAYFVPPMPRNEPLVPQIGIDSGDDFEINRLMRIAVGEYLGHLSRTNPAVFLQSSDSP
jgi:hypothetical protein